MIIIKDEAGLEDWFPENEDDLKTLEEMDSKGRLDVPGREEKKQ